MNNEQLISTEDRIFERAYKLMRRKNTNCVTGEDGRQRLVSFQDAAAIIAIVENNRALSSIEVTEAAY